MFSHTVLSFKDPGLVYSKSFDMDQPQTYRRSEFHVGWMRGVLVCDNSLLPKKKQLPL